ncbi:exopolysaccharide biosynthesis protein [Halomonas kashgarensis]|uniref:exopolysaccharide biosynthesis protein n=1 Tax=Halomonas kashgarensis TaxID=3084920 RepID=UPI003A8CF4F6
MDNITNRTGKISMDDVVEAVGRRSFGPLLLVTGLITLAPVVGDIPGMPTLMALMVLLVTVQLLAGREHFWLPNWLLKRSMSRRKFDKGLHWMRKPAGWIDHVLSVRLPWLTGYIGIRLTAVACLMIALAMPPMEVVPFTANGAGLALTLFGLGLVARDGVALLLAFVITGATFAFVLGNFI